MFNGDCVSVVTNIHHHCLGVARNPSSQYGVVCATEKEKERTLSIQHSTFKKD